MPRRYQTISDLPGEIAIFPLAGAILLPRASLPLNIFEPRYLEMVQQAIGSHRLIGMIQPKNPKGPLDHPEVYPTGCVGRITSFAEADDGRYLITLAGVSRFDIARELPMGNRLHRQVEVSYERFADDLGEPSEPHLDRERLTPALKGYFSLHGLTADWETIERTPDHHLITCLAMICPFKPNEKQALLECPTTAARADTMITLIEMALHEGRGRKPSRLRQ